MVAVRLTNSNKVLQIDKERGKKGFNCIYKNRIKIITSSAVHSLHSLHFSFIL